MIHAKNEENHYGCVHWAYYLAKEVNMEHMSEPLYRRNKIQRHNYFEVHA